MPQSNQPLLDVRELKVHFYTYAGIVEALDGVNLQVNRGETAGIVGETGCGKSVTALSIMGLVPSPGKIVGGEILFQGADLRRISPGEMRKIRGKKISMIFQDPMTYLNPVLTIGDQIMEVIRLHEDTRRIVHDWRLRDDSDGDSKNQQMLLGNTAKGLHNESSAKPSRSELKRALRWKVVETLRLVRMPSPDKVFGEYPHELSGGMRQRAIIAMMISTRPDLLIADEPTTALDVTIQAQVLRILRELKTDMGLSMILITHDLGIVAENCDVVSIMYAGRVVESGPVTKIFENPQHPYTQGLLRSLPTIDMETEQLPTIAGSVPSLISPPRGCRFHPRCPYAMPVCKEKRPKLMPTEEGHLVACYLQNEESDSDI